MAIETIENCTVEWDKDRGVLYVHSGQDGHTVVRVCGLKKDVTTTLDSGMLDIAHPERVIYPE